MTSPTYFIPLLLLITIHSNECQFSPEEMIACTVAQQGRFFDKFWTKPVTTPDNMMKITVDQFFDTNVTVFMDGELPFSEAIAKIQEWSNSGLLDLQKANNVISDLSKAVAANDFISTTFTLTRGDADYFFIASAQTGSPPYAGHRSVSLGGSFARLRLKKTPSGITFSPFENKGKEFGDFTVHLAITSFLKNFINNYASLKRASKETSSNLPRQCMQID